MSAAPYTLRVLERVRDVPAADWDALLGDESSPFVEHRWLDALEETGCVGQDTGWVPAHLSLWRAEKLVAVAPSYIKGHSEGEFVFDWSWADFARRAGIRYYPKVVVAVPFTPATGDRVLVSNGENRAEVTRLIATAAREWCTRIHGSSVHVLFPREAEANDWEACGYYRRDGFQFHWFRDGARNFDDYLGRFSSKRRNQIKRELRDVRQAGIIVETLAPEGHTREIARTMHDLYASTIDKHGVWGRLYLNARFFESIVERFRDRLAWVVARRISSGEIIGGAFNVTRGRHLYGRYWGARAEVPFLHFAVCYYAGIMHCVERGLDVFEPGAGGEHKQARGFIPTLTHSVHWLSDPRLRSALAPWLERERARVQEIVRSEASE
jgi:predicted N-acyltransferase